MLSLVLVYSLVTRATAATPGSDGGALASCDNINNCRTLSNIIWSCITTIFLCTWVAIHPNIPEPIDTARMGFFRKIILAIRQFILYKLWLFFCALLVPEFILAWAIRQYVVARGIAGDCNEFTTTHGFFIAMGGFHYFETRSNQTGPSDPTTNAPIGFPLLENAGRPEAAGSLREIPAHPLNKWQVIAMVDSGAITLPTEAEIKDRSKSDWIAKTIVLLQTIWFIIQCIARRIERLPTTELEIVTLAYTAINLGIFIAWWSKPQSVDCPIRVSRSTERDVAREQSLDTDLRSERIAYEPAKKAPFFDTGEGIVVFTGVITLLVGVVFGAIHCIAWSFEFPSHTVALLWRVSSASITVVPVFLLLIFPLLAVALAGNTIPILAFPLGLLYLLSGVLYLAARVTTVVLAFKNLSSAPPGVFQAVYWTTLIPHV